MSNCGREEELEVVCAWCGAHIRGPRHAPKDRISHGICSACVRKWMDPPESDSEQGEEVKGEGRKG